MVKGLVIRLNTRTHKGYLATEGLQFLEHYRYLDSVENRRGKCRAPSFRNVGRPG